jgi:hypothetical protein
VTRVEGHSIYNVFGEPYPLMMALEPVSGQTPTRSTPQHPGLTRRRHPWRPLATLPASSPPRVNLLVREFPLPSDRVPECDRDHPQARAGRRRWQGKSLTCTFLVTCPGPPHSARIALPPICFGICERAA